MTPTPSAMPYSPLVRDLRKSLGPENVLSAPSELAVYDCDGYTIEKHRPDAVVFPRSTEQVAEGTLLIENQMPGYWEILFQSTTLTPGKRYVVDAFIPQRGSAARLTLTVDRRTSTVRYDGVELDCKVVREADTGLVFYLYDGELIQYRDDTNGVTLTKIL